MLLPPGFMVGAFNYRKTPAFIVMTFLTFQVRSFLRERQGDWCEAMLELLFGEGQAASILSCLLWLLTDATLCILICVLFLNGLWTLMVFGLYGGRFTTPALISFLSFLREVIPDILTWIIGLSEGYLAMIERLISSEEPSNRACSWLT
ncbi:uncharacterized protein FFMR_11553 [Fusarium fujikuroi]|nr:uncharacterized protein FFMR_11553 [Fusarium fujikuroi]